MTKINNFLYNVNMKLEELKLTDKRMNICKRLDLNDSDDILHYYPFKYEEFNSYTGWNINEFKKFLLNINNEINKIKQN